MTIGDDQITVGVNKGIVVVSAMISITAVCSFGVMLLVTAFSMRRQSELLDELDSVRWAANACEVDRTMDGFSSMTEALGRLRNGPAPDSHRCWLVKRTPVADLMSCER